MQIVRFASLDSTNNEAQKEIYKHNDVIVAQFQTDGRGQRGNVWVSQKGENLMCSFVFELHIEVAKQYLVSMIAALAGRDAIRNLGLECQVKWPNDLYVHNKKIGGILIEHNSMGEFLCRSVIGIGINVNQKKFDPKLPNPTSFIIEGREVAVDAVLDELCSSFEKRINENVDLLHRDFMESLWRKNGLYRFSDANGMFLATIEKVDKYTGEITLKDSNGKSRNYWFKEVEFVL